MKVTTEDEEVTAEEGSLRFCHFEMRVSKTAKVTTRMVISGMSIKTTVPQLMKKNSDEILLLSDPES